MAPYSQGHMGPLKTLEIWEVIMIWKSALTDLKKSAAVKKTRHCIFYAGLILSSPSYPPTHPINPTNPSNPPFHQPHNPNPCHLPLQLLMLVIYLFLLRIYLSKHFYFPSQAAWTDMPQSRSTCHKPAKTLWWWCWGCWWWSWWWR